MSLPANHQRRDLLVGTLAVLLWVVRAPAGEPNHGLKPEILGVGFTKTAFLNVNRNDMEAGFKALAEMIGRKRGYLVQVKTPQFETDQALETAIKDGSVNLAVLDSWSYLAMNAREITTPVFVGSDQGQVGREFVLLTRCGSGLNTLADLRGKEVAIYEVANTSMGRYWLESQLLANHLGAPTAFFSRVESVGKPSAAVLPVFFGTKPACLVDTLSFEVMKELNPQVGKGLQAVANSERIVNIITCLSHSGWPDPRFKQVVIEALGELHLEIDGHQILMLFKDDRLMPFQDAYLDSVRTLWKNCDQLLKESLP